MRRWLTLSLFALLPSEGLPGSVAPSSAASLGRDAAAAEPAPEDKPPSPLADPIGRPLPETSPVARRLVYPKGEKIWIRERPDARSRWLGYLSWGTPVELKDEKVARSPDCPAGYREIEPSGYVCVDGVEATLDEKDPFLERIAALAPKLDSSFPHQYAVAARRATRFRSLTEATGGVESEGVWADFSPEKLPAWPRGHTGSPGSLRRGSAVAYLAQIERNGRSFLLTSDMTWLRKVDVELVVPSDFKGISLDESHGLPVGFLRHVAPLYGLSTGGPVVRTLGRNGVLFLENSAANEGGFVKVRNESLWVSLEALTIPRPEAPKARASEGSEANTALEISVLGGWLIAYRNGRPVYATLISAGRGGLPHPGRPLVETASTPLGKYPIGAKFRTITMNAPGTTYTHFDVPWTQNIDGPHSIHSTYWHEDLGLPRSAGCVNVAPRDGRWLFDFTEPKLPPGWHAIRPKPGSERTLVHLHP